MSTKKYVSTGVAGLQRRPEPSADGTITYKSTIYGFGYGKNGSSKNEVFPPARDEGMKAATMWHAGRQNGFEEGERPASKTKVLDDVRIEAFEQLKTVLVRSNKNLGSLENFETAYERRIRKTLGHVKMKDLNEAASPILLRWLRDLRKEPVSESTQYGTLVALRFILREALAKKYISRDPLAGIPKKEFPSQKKTEKTKITRVVTPHEAHLTMEAALTDAFAERFTRKDSGELRYAAVVNIGGGQRPSETAGLRWEDVVLIEGRFGTNGQIARGGAYAHPTSERTDTKTGDYRTTPMVGLVREAFEKQLLHERSKGLGNDSDYVFTDWRGQPFDRYAISNAVRVAAELADLGHLTAKNFRATFATTLALAGINAESSSNWMGHSRKTQEEHYIQPIIDTSIEQDAVARIEALGFGRTSGQA